MSMLEAETHFLAYVRRKTPVSCVMEWKRRLIHDHSKERLGRCLRFSSVQLISSFSLSMRFAAYALVVSMLLIAGPVHAVSTKEYGHLNNRAVRIFFDRDLDHHWAAELRASPPTKTDPDNGYGCLNKPDTDFGFDGDQNDRISGSGFKNLINNHFLQCPGDHSIGALNRWSNPLTGNPGKNTGSG